MTALQNGGERAGSNGQSAVTGALQERKGARETCTARGGCMVA